MKGKSKFAEDHNVIPLIDEQNMYGKGSDHYLALVCTANTVTNKLQSQDFKSNICSEPNTETVNTRNLMASLDKRVAKPKVVGSIDVDLTSCHCFSEHEVSFLALEISDGIEEDKSCCSYKGMTRNRSFHTDTVEEFDAMLKNILYSEQQRGLDEGRKTSSSTISHHCERKESGLQERKGTFLQEKALVYENFTDNFSRSETDTKS